MFNSRRPKKGDFWKKVASFSSSDSLKNEWFEIDKLRSLAREKGRQYLIDVNKVVQANGQLVLSKDNLIQLFTSLPPSYKEIYFNNYEFIYLYTRPHWVKAALAMQDSQLTLFLLQGDDTALKEKKVINGLFPEDSTLFQDQNDELILWEQLYIIEDSVQWSDSFARFCEKIYRGYIQRQRIALGESFFITDKLNEIDSCFMTLADTNWSIILRARQNNEVSYWRQGISSTDGSALFKLLQSEP